MDAAQWDACVAVIEAARSLRAEADVLCGRSREIVATSQRLRLCEVGRGLDAMSSSGMRRWWYRPVTGRGMVASPQLVPGECVPG